MIRAYMYVIYRVYSFLVKVENATPLFSTAGFMVFVHWMQIYLLIMIMEPFYHVGLFSIKKDFKAYGIVLVLIAIYYFALLATYKKYFKEFKQEQEGEKRRNRKTLLVFLFTWGSIILLMLLLLP